MLVRFGEQPARIADDFMQEVRPREIDKSCCLAKSYKVGTSRWQRLIQGLVGTINRIDDKDRLVVLTNRLDRQVKEYKLLPRY